MYIATAIGLAAGAASIALRMGISSANAAAVPAASAEVDRKSAQTRGEAKRARERAAALDRQTRSALLASDKAMLGLAALAARVQQAEAALGAAEADLALASERRRALARRLAEENAPATQLLAGLQTQLRYPPLLQLLAPGSIEDAVHLRAVVTAVEPQLRERTAALRIELQNARLLENDVSRIAAQRRRLQSDLAARRSELAAVAVAERLKARRASLAGDREVERAFALAEETRNLPAFVRRLEAGTGRSAPRPAAPRAAPDHVSAQSALTAPHRMPVDARPAALQSSPRKGLTLAPRPGALVVAPGPGRVAFAGPYEGFGRIVIIEHAEGWTSLLTGLAGTDVAIGQSVMAGSPLGRATTRDPRITVELRRDGMPVDPTTQLR